MLKILLIGFCLLIPLSAGAQSPPSDLELLQSRTESAEAQGRYLQLLIQRLQVMYETRLETAMEWLKAAQSAEAKTSTK